MCMTSQHVALNCMTQNQPRFRRPIYPTRCFLCLIPAIEKTLSLTENLDFTPASGPIEVRQFFKIQTRARPEPNPARKARARLTTMVCTLVQYTLLCKCRFPYLKYINRHFEIKHQKLFKDDLNKNEAFKKAVSRYEKLGSIVKKSFAVQINARKVDTKLQNALPSAESILRRYITQFFIGTQTYV